MTQNERIGLTVPEAAKQIGIGPALAWRLVKSGEMPSIKLGSRRIVPVDKLREWMNRSATVTTVTTVTGKDA